MLIFAHNAELIVAMLCEYWFERENVIKQQSCCYSQAPEAGLAQWCHQCLQGSPTRAFHLMTDCQSSLFFYQAATADSWISSAYFPSFGRRHSVGIKRISLETDKSMVHIYRHILFSEIRPITLSDEYFHNSTLSVLFLLVILGLAPTEKKNKNRHVNEHYITRGSDVISHNFKISCKLLFNFS